ncbi:MAG TPA: type II toxin-antitoxin system prevent-host-death family antitoxin [Bryobacteraceae bacterium]|jgi:prevent-host-death family protein|nr:type II toxin-antitoxin system prevent-host-death family antitoxin [Bryobacteraceae bacterium]
MREVNISELKARLSHYVRLAENGEEVVVKDRERPVARIIGAAVRASRLRVIPARLTHEEARKALAATPKPKLTRRVVEETLRWMKEDRSERWSSKKRK